MQEKQFQFRSQKRIQEFGERRNRQTQVTFFRIFISSQNRKYISSSNTLFLTMRHQKFYEIVNKVIMLSTNSNKFKEKKLDPLQKCIFKLKDHFLNMPPERQEKNLQIVNNLNTYQYNPSRYRLITAAHVQKIQVLQEQIANLQQLISQKYQQLTHITTNLGQKTKLTQSHELKLYQLQQQIARQQERIKEISAKSSEFEDNLRTIEQKYKDAVYFVNNQQKNKILQQVSKQYKQIESDIYEYAVYLQSNQLANDMHYEPHPFTEIQTHMSLELKQIIADLSKNKEKTIPQKCIQMKEFVQASMSIFKKKDIEMRKLNEFRTKCIVNFIQKMKKWLNNWELKQEYLANLKKQFVGICIILKQTIHFNISNHSQQINPESIRNQFRKMLKMVQQLELNFNHGNSFY